MSRFNLVRLEERIVPSAMWYGGGGHSDKGHSGKGHAYGHCKGKGHSGHDDFKGRGHSHHCGCAAPAPTEPAPTEPAPPLPPV